MCKYVNVEDVNCKRCDSNRLTKSGKVWRGKNGNRKLYQQWLCDSCGLVSVKVKSGSNEILIPYEESLK